MWPQKGCRAGVKDKYVLQTMPFLPSLFMVYILCLDVVFTRSHMVDNEKYRIRPG